MFGIKQHVESVRNWYAEFERPISSLSLIGGFLFDIFTLTRVDKFWENFWVIAHFAIVGVCIVWIHSLEDEAGAEKDPSRAHFWLVNVLQFFFGGLLSTFLVFYFRSSDISVSWPFILLLALAFVANEHLKQQFVRLTFQISLFFLSLFSFAIFLVPVISHEIGPRMFLISGAVSLVIIGLFLFILFHTHKEKYAASSRSAYISVGIIFILVNILYFTHILPPIPLSLKDAGVYHSISKNVAGDYEVAYERLTWPKNLTTYITLYPAFHQVSGEPVVAYSAIFSPSDLDTTVIHEWQYDDPERGTWVTYSTVTLPVVGGREGGFRTYSAQSDLPAGHWRVNVKTLQGEVIGRIRFTIVPATSEPATDIKINI